VVTERPHGQCRDGTPHRRGAAIGPGEHAWQADPPQCGEHPDPDGEFGATMRDTGE
jgi:hypothetical protein